MTSRYLAAKAASILGMLRNFNLLNLLTDGGTIAGSVLADNTDFLCVLGLQREETKDG